MSVELADQEPDDIEEALTAWFAPVRPSGIIRVPTSDPLPFTLITHISGPENVDESLSEPLVSVHTLCDKNLGGNNMGWAAAKDESKKTHSRMLRLAQHVDPITLPSGSVVAVDYVDVTESPIWVPYGDDQILQKIGRYTIGITYQFVASS